MDWLTVYTEDIAVREGIIHKGGQVHRVEDLSPDAYEKVILYRTRPNLVSTEKTEIANIDSYHKLNVLLDAAFTTLYRRGIIE